MKNKPDFKISPKYFASAWTGLSLSKKDSTDWANAIDIFEDRINGRFLKQVDELINNQDKEIRAFAGFVIMAIDCLLIETIEQFQRGKKRTGQNKDEEMFHDFFQRSTELKAFFNSPDKTKVFYSQIRCGILHQAQTKKHSTIHIKKSTPVLSWVDVNDIQQGISINRNKFHKEVKNIFNDYISKLRKGVDKNMRDKMKRKMDFIVAQS